MNYSRNLTIRWSLFLAALLLVPAAWLAPIRESRAEDARRNQPQSAKAGQSLADGRQIFEGRCTGCHGLDGRGGERAPDIATRAAVQQRSDEKLYQIIKAGNPTAGMPAFPSLDDGSVKALIAYVRILQGKGPPTTISGNPQNGQALFFGKARCADCHMLSGKGGFIASDLSPFGQGRSPAEIREAILTPRTVRTNAITLLTTRTGDKLSGVIRNEDNFSVQLQSLDGSFHLLMKANIENQTQQPGSVMPSDYASTLSARELDDLIGFLMTVANKDHPSTGKRQIREDEEDE